MNEDYSEDRDIIFLQTKSNSCSVVEPDGAVLLGRSWSRCEGPAPAAP